MGLQDLITSVIGIADSVTKEVQVTVIHEAAQLNADGSPVDDGFGNLSFDGAAEVQMLLENEQRLIRTHNGQDAMSQAKLTVLQPLQISVHDRISLPDGRTGPILRIKGLHIGGELPALGEFWMGSESQQRGA